MKTAAFSKQDEKQAKKRGIAAMQMAAQMSRFKKGFPFVRLISPCVVKKGILQLNQEEQKKAAKLFLSVGAQKKVIKFVPASGAASRMFHFLEDPKPEYDLLKQKFLSRLPDFAFYVGLTAALRKTGQNIQELRKTKKIKPIVAALLEDNGLGYRRAPKGMILFHRDGKQTRTAFEEQLSEGVIFKNKKNQTWQHFTLPVQARKKVRSHLNQAAVKNKGKQRIFLSDSIQSFATDCLAAERNGLPVRDENGALLFRPAGHGALLGNLNSLRADLIYVKNIDNILPRAHSKEADQWKRILCGVFLEHQAQIFNVQKILKKNKMTPEEALIAIRLAQKLSGGEGRSREFQNRKSLERFFNRPLRVCGMVPNTGEPGGGPFWTKDSQNNISAQIVESAEVNFKSKEQERIWRSSTHFNPVDFVCGVCDFRGKKYDLMKFADPERGLVTQKAYQGREIRVMELPGLWNGGMANWLSLFVEIPAKIFAPVKTALDLLRPEHQP